MRPWTQTGKRLSNPSGIPRLKGTQCFYVFVVIQCLFLVDLHVFVVVLHFSVVILFLLTEFCSLQTRNINSHLIQSLNSPWSLRPLGLCQVHTFRFPSSANDTLYSTKIILIISDCFLFLSLLFFWLSLKLELLAEICNLKHIFIQICMFWFNFDQENNLDTHQVQMEP